MKKLYILSISLAMCVVAVAQQFEHIGNQITTDFRASDDASQQSLRGGDEPFWSSDFSDDSVWESETTLGNYGWEILTTGGGWFYGNNPINSDSGGEFAFVWNGDPTDATEVLLQADYDLTTVNAIDVSSIESAVLEFQVYGARFTDSLKVQVSNDGMNFTTIGNHQDIGQLTAGGGSVTANPLLRSYNMTLNVEGQDELWIRFNFQTASSGIAYGWYVDDLNIYIPEDYDLAIGDVYTGDIINDYEYTTTPLPQAHTLNLGGNITNLGGAEASNAKLYAEVFLDGDATPVYTGESDVQNIIQGETQQFWIFTDYIPSQEGDYTVVYEAIQDEVDAIPGDNTNDKPFRMHEYLWGNEDYNNINTDFDGALGDVLAGDEWILGTSFTSFQAGSQFQAALVSFAPGTAEGAEVSMTLWLIGDNGLEFLTSTDYTITEEDASAFNSEYTAIEMDDQEDLEVGNTYVIGLQHLPGEGNVVVDCSTFDNDFSTFIYGAYGVGGVVDWFVFDDISPAILLGLDDIDNVAELGQSNLSIGQSFPNPISGEMTIPLVLETASKVTLDIHDVAGKVIYTEDFGTLSSGSNNLVISDLNLVSGVYSFSVNASGTSVSNTFISN